MKTKLILFFLLGIDAVLLFLQTSQLSISSVEASILYGEFSFLQVSTDLFLKIFGHTDVGLRSFMILLHMASAYLLFEISAHYLKRQKDRLLLVLFFILLPGSVSSGLVINHGSVIIFGVFLYIYLLHKISEWYTYPLLLLYYFIEPGFSYLFLSLALYYFFEKRYKEMGYTFGLYLLSIGTYGFVAHGIPRGHFLDTLAVYSAIFSPLIFIYIFYALYRRYFMKQRDRVWFIATTVLMISIVLSFRQKINLEYFAPYVMLALPLAAQTFSNGYYVRLPMFRKRYSAMFFIALLFLLINTIVVFFNKELYLYMENPKKHFAYKLDIASALAKQLKEQGIYCVQSDPKMQIRLRFYGVTQCKQNRLKEVKLSNQNTTDVTIRYKNKTLYQANVTKLNNK